MHDRATMQPQTTAITLQSSLYNALLLLVRNLHNQLLLLSKFDTVIVFSN